MSEVPFIDQDIPIGTKYICRNKQKICEVVDIHKTYNHAGDLVRTRYVVSHWFTGQFVINRDVVKVTIQKALVAAS